MQAGGKGRRAGPQMRRQLQVEGAGERRDAHRLGDAAADRQIGLHDVDRAEHREIAEIVAGELALARRRSECRSTARTCACPALSSAVTGSSNQARLQSSTRRQKRLASATDIVPCASHISPISGPSASRAACTRARRMARVAVDDADAHLDRAEAAGRDIARAAARRSCPARPSRPRHRPASSRRGGRRAAAIPAAPSDFPRMSHSAQSTPLIADIVMPRRPSTGKTRPSRSA